MQDVRIIDLFANAATAITLGCTMFIVVAGA